MNFNILSFRSRRAQFIPPQNSPGPSFYTRIKDKAAQVKCHLDYDNFAGANNETDAFFNANGACIDVFFQFCADAEKCEGNTGLGYYFMAKRAVETKQLTHSRSIQTIIIKAILNHDERVHDMGLQLTAQAIESNIWPKDFAFPECVINLPQQEHLIGFHLCQHHLALKKKEQQSWMSRLHWRR